MIVNKVKSRSKKMNIQEDCFCEDWSTEYLGGVVGNFLKSNRQRNCNKLRGFQK